MVERNEAANTINGRLRTIRAMIKMGRMIGTVNFTIEVENVKSRVYRDTRGPGLLGFRDMKRVTQSREDQKGVRDVVILRLLFDLALRRCEVAALDLEDVDLKNNKISVLGKGRTEKESFK